MRDDAAATARRRVAALARHACAASSSSSSSSREGDRAARVVVVGGMVLDVQACPSTGERVARGTTAPGVVTQRPGGVGRNVAEGVSRFAPSRAAPPLLVAAVGDDVGGRALVAAWRDLPGRPSSDGVRVCAGETTPVVSAVIDETGEVAAAIASTTLVETGLDATWLRRHRDALRRARVVVVDGNVAPDVVAAATAFRDDVTPRRASSSSSPSPPLVWFEPVSAAKATRAGRAGVLHRCDVVSPNARELRAMADDARRERRGEPPPRLSASGGEDLDLDHEAADADVALAAARAHEDVVALLREGVGTVALTLGPLGVLLCRKPSASATTTTTRRPGAADEDEDGGAVVYAHYPACPEGFGDGDARVCVVSAVGAGDAFVAGAVAAVAAGWAFDDAVAVGVAASRRAVETDANVPFDPRVVSFTALAKDAREVRARVKLWTATSSDAAERRAKRRA